MSRPGRPRISTGIHESKTLALYNAGRLLLAEQDFEAISVAQLAKLARCSVGAFYVRFPDKTAFLFFVIRHSFDFAARSLADALTSGGIKALGFPAKAQLAILRLTEQFADAEFAGALRAAVKLALSEPQARTSLDHYRDAVTDHLTEWIAGARARQEPQIRAALQIILATLTDTALSKLRTNSLKFGALHDAQAFLLQNAASGTLKSVGKTAREKPSKTASTESLPNFPLQKPPESASKNPAKTAAPKSERQKSRPVSPTRRIRKI